MFDRLDDLLIRYQEVMGELQEPGVADDQGRFRKLMKERVIWLLSLKRIRNIRIVNRMLMTVSPCLKKRTMKRCARWRKKS